MRTSTGSLEMQFLMDASKYDAEMKRVKKELSAFGTEAKKAAGNAERSFNSFFNNLDKSVSKSSSSLERHRRDVKETASAYESMSASMKGLAGLPAGAGAAAGAIAGAMSFGVIREAVDYYTKVTSILRNATDGQLAYNIALKDVQVIARQTQGDLSAISTFYARVTNSIKEYGMEQDKSNVIVSTVSNSLRAMGATTYEAASAMLQLSQGFQSGRLGGEEFRAVMESAPILMRQLAKSMGKTFGELKTLSAEGKIGIEEMTKAWADKDFMLSMQEMAKNTHTITGAMTNMRNELSMLVGEMMDTTNGSRSIIAIIDSMTEAFGFLIKNMDMVASGVIAYAGVMLTKGVMSLVAMRNESIANRAANLQLALSNKATADSELALARSVTAKTVTLQSALVAEEKAVMAKAHYAASNVNLIQTEIAAAKAALQKQVANGTAARSSSALAVAESVLAQKEKELAAATALANTYATQSAEIKKAQSVASAANTAMIQKEIAATAAAAAATKQLEAAQAGWLSRTKNMISNLMGKAGWIGLALWGAYEIADYFGVIDQVFSGAEERMKRMREKVAKEAAALSSMETRAAIDRKQRELNIIRAEADSALKKGGIFNSLTYTSKMGEYDKKRKELDVLKELVDEKAAIEEVEFNITDEYRKRTNTADQNLKADLLDAQDRFNKEMSRLTQKNAIYDESKMRDLGERYARDVDAIREKYANKESKVKTGGGKPGGRSIKSDELSTFESELAQLDKAYLNSVSKAGYVKDKQLALADSYYDSLTKLKKKYGVGEFSDRAMNPEDTFWDEVSEARQKKLEDYQERKAEAISRIFTESLNDEQRQATEVWDKLTADVEMGIRTWDEAASAYEHTMLKTDLVTERFKESLSESQKVAYDTWAKFESMADIGVISWEEAGKRYKDAMSDIMDESKELRDALKSDLADWLQNFDGGLKGLFDAFSSTLKKMAAEWAAAEFMKSIFPSSGGSVSSSSGSSDFLGGLFKTGLNLWSMASGGTQAPAPVTDLSTQYVPEFREGGGQVSAGKPYIVGEKRPELFIPNQSGRIEPSVNQGGITVIQHFNFTGAQPDKRTMLQVGREAQAGLATAARRNG